jgi:hypothetical protein
MTNFSCPSSTLPRTLPLTEAIAKLDARKAEMPESFYTITCEYSGTRREVAWRILFFKNFKCDGMTMMGATLQAAMDKLAVTLDEPKLAPTEMVASAEASLR